MNKKPVLHLYNSLTKAKLAFLAFEDFLCEKERIVKISSRDLKVELEDEIHWFSYHAEHSDLYKHYGCIYGDIIFNLELPQGVKNFYLSRIMWYKE